MASIVKTCDLPLQYAVDIFGALNPGKIKVKKLLKSTERETLEDRMNYGMGIHIFTDINPEELVYPEGWYFAKSHFRNKHMSTTGLYEEALVWHASRDEIWE